VVRRKPTKINQTIQDRRMEVAGSTMFYHEDDYCQIQLLPIENYPELIQQISNISSKSSKNFDGTGYKEIVIRADQEKKLEDRKIKKEELEKILSKLKTERHSIVATGYGLSYRIESKNTIAYGTNNSAIFFDYNPENGNVQNFWIVNPKQLESAGLKEIMSEIVTKWELVLTDWNLGLTLDWKDFDKVEKYFAN